MGSDHTFITTKLQNVRDVLQLAAGPASDGQGRWYLLIQIHSRRVGGGEEQLRVDQFVMPANPDLNMCLDALSLAFAETLRRSQPEAGAAHD